MSVTERQQAVRIEGLTVAYRRRGRLLRVLDDVSFSIGRGEFVFLVGASGSGKSTTMRLLIKETEPTGNLDPETSIGIMQLLYRINRTGTTVVVATHDVEMVDRMRRRVIELAAGRVVRDERAGAYAARETTQEFGARLWRNR